MQLFFSIVKLKNLLLIACILVLMQNNCFSENKQKMDSLSVLLQKANKDTIKLNLYLNILEECDFENNLMYAEPALKLVDEILKKNTNTALRKILLKRKIEIIDFIIPYYANKGKQDNRLEFDKIQLNIFIELGDTANIINTLETLSGIYKLIGNIPKSLSYNQYGINISKKMKYLKGELKFMSNLANLYIERGDTAAALNKLNSILKANIMQKDSDNIAYTYERIGFLYLDKKDTVSAKVNIIKSIKLHLSIKKSSMVNYIKLSSIARMYSSLGDYKNSLFYAKNALENSMIEDNGNGYSEMLYFNGVINSWAGDTAKSIFYHKKAIEVRENSKFLGLNFSLFHLAQIYFLQKKLKLAKINAEKHLKICNSIGIIDNIADAELLCSRIDSASSNFKSAYFHFSKYVLIKNKIKSDEVLLMASREKFQKEYDHQKSIEKAKQDKKDAIVKLEAQRKNTIIIFVVIGLFIALVFATFIYRSLTIRKKQNKLIEKQKTALETSYKNLELLNKISNEITSSINLTSVMELIYKNVSALMDVSFFIISKYNEIDNTVEIKYSVKQGKIVEEEFKTTILNPNSYIAKTIDSKKEIIVLDEEVERSKFLAGPSTLHGKEDINTKSHIFIPLFVKDKVIGLFSVQSLNKNAYSKTHIDILRSLAPVIAVALNNAEAYQKIDQANVEIKAQKNIVEEKQKEILDSIEYALRIQTAILPPQKIVKQHLENSFILYKPKDIVAGDFYWMETVQLADENNLQLADEKNIQLTDEIISELANENKLKNNQLINSSANQLILFAACDCTGHGVPGAMVSVVCHNALNRAVKEFGLTTPAEILDKTQEIVLENFSKSEEDIKDGMDISLCALNFNKVQNFAKATLQWAGANNPLWLIRNGEFVEVKADKQPIGMDENHHPFTNHTFNLEKGDAIYIFSDGYADQFSPTDKKLMKKNFKNLLLSIQNKSMQDQHDYLNDFIENWKGNMEQTDDILVIGVKI